MSLVCPRCQRVSALGELCPDHGLHGVTPAALSTLDDAPLLGHVLNGQFALTDLIGQGGMGTVYRGLDLTLHRELAVKVLHAHLTATRKDRERFEREARALSRLRSASTVTLYQFGVVREGPLANLAFMAMEAVEGTSLARRLSRGPVGLEEIAEILDQLADSLGEAHQLGIVHRDLKPENILLTQTHDGRLRVKTIDFGIARLDGATRSGSGLLSGTPHYMAPEQCAAAEADTLDGRVDVYAVGVILFQALTGERPFDGRDPLQILVKQVNEPVPQLPGADRPGNSQALDVVVQRALAKDKAHRYATVGELARAYRSVLSALGGAVVPLFDSPRGVAEGRSAELSDTMAAARGALEGRRPAPPRTGLRWRFVALAAKVAPTRARVLIHGESGTGKELIARAIHDQSDRAAAPFVKVNCAAIPDELIESTLFGHEKGAFTGAAGRQRGQFELADGGTLFLDEIGDMSLSAQAKVLRVLQSGELTRVGSERPIKVDVRVLAATHKDLEAACRAGLFREDLFFRLNVVPLTAPPLRLRGDDIPVLAEHFLDQVCEENGFRRKHFEPDVLEALAAWRWPGNVRELRNVVERMAILSGEVIGVEDLPDHIGEVPERTVSDEAALAGEGTLRDLRDAAERRFILERLEASDWNISRTAESLGLERTHLHKKMRALGLRRERG